MRKGASGWLAKGLLLLLVASFALWGIGGDMLGSSAGSGVIEVGEQSVTLGEFQREYRNRLNQVSNYLNRQITVEEARNYGVTQSTIMSIQTRLLEKERVRELGLGISDVSVLKELKNSPNFRNAAGQFDRLRFETLLRQNGYSEREYLDILADELKRQQLMVSLQYPAGDAPDYMAEILFDHYLEKRKASYIELPDSDITGAPVPTDEELSAFIKDNAEQFTAPEFRKADILFLSPEKFVSEAEVSEEQIKAEYEGRASEFIIPERRQILQMIFDDEETAQEAVARLTGGADFATVANELLQLTPADIDLGLLTKTELLDEMQEPVFNAEEGAITAPVKTVLGWHIVEVAKIEAGRTRGLEEVRDQLKNTIALREAADILYEKSTQLEDEIAGGATISEAASAIGVKAQSIDWTNRNGQTADGQPSSGLPPVPEIRGILFSTEPESELELHEAANGTYFALSVTDVKPSALKELNEVREEALSAWQADWRHQENAKKAEELLGKLKAGDAIDSLGFEVKTSAEATRNANLPGFSSNAVDALFELDKGASAFGETDTGTGYVVFTLTDIIAADREQEKELLTQLKQDLTNGINQDINQQYLSYLEKSIGVSVKENLIREYF
ncbi:SurA N-terminal domain-containing protein [Sneathiella glossodoripedis]|uniref:SurA N-terminal domain-containing protein n=1 Tax=Sneathiella glossodoripedis TaxID=418853 RepID=UPI00131EEE98|nr:SurA N-terminal domain-containing protein [Sneathiella glossodoripedis]